MKTIVTITGIRPDFIRMSMVFKELDKNFNHILIHTGQHYDTNLSDVFFQQLNIRQPDYILNTGKSSSNHFEQLSYLSTEIPKLFKTHNINPELILFLGDSNSAGVSFPLKKEGYKIGHIEAGMRSYDKRMLEEINRTVCDHCSDILFVYHENYKQYLIKENITKNIYVVGNTIVEPLMLFKNEIIKINKRKDMILLDIHRPENFKYVNRLQSIFDFANTHPTQTTEAAQGTLWGAYNSISGYYNYIAPFRTQEDKFNSQMFGNANNKINKAFEKARILTLS